MTLKLTNQASETILRKLPLELQREISQFIKRNSLLAKKDAEKYKIYPCCHACLKAHLLTRAPKHEEVINSHLDCEPGHQGYYLDGKELKIIEE